MGRVCSVSSGTAAAPAFAFKENPGTGVYLAEAGKLGFSVNGEAKMFLTGTTRSFVADAGYAIDLPKNNNDHLPASPSQGMIYYNSTDQLALAYDGTTWRRFAFIPDGVSVTENVIPRFYGEYSNNLSLQDSGLKEDGTEITLTNTNLYAGDFSPAISFSSNGTTGLYYDSDNSEMVVLVDSVITARIANATGHFKFFADMTVDDLILGGSVISINGGTSEAPSISFTSSTGTGFSRPIANEIHFSREGSFQVEIFESKVECLLSLILGTDGNYTDLYCTGCECGAGTVTAPGLSHSSDSGVGLWNNSGNIRFVAGSEIESFWMTGDPPTFNIYNTTFTVNDIIMNGSYIDLTSLDYSTKLFFLSTNTPYFSGGSNGLRLMMDYGGGDVHTIDFGSDGVMTIKGSNASDFTFDLMSGPGYVSTVGNLYIDSGTIYFYWVSNGSGYDLGLDADGKVVYDSSSIRYKRDLSPVSFSYGLDTIGKLRPVSFNFIGFDRRNIGFIAEEVLQVFPEVVLFDKDNNPSSIDYGRLAVLPILVLNGIKMKLDNFDLSFSLNTGGVPFDVFGHSADLTELKEAERKSRLSVEDLEKEFNSLSEELAALVSRVGLV